MMCSREVNGDEVTKGREVEEAKEKEEDGGQMPNGITQDEINGETQAVPPQKTQRKRKNEDSQDEERSSQEGSPKEEGEVISVHSENDGSNPRREDEGMDAKMDDEDSTQKIVAEMEKLGKMCTTWAPNIGKTEIRYLFLHNLRELSYETIENLGGESEHLVNLYTRLQTKTKSIPLEVVENDDLCNLAAAAIMAKAETVMRDLRSEVEMKETFVKWTSNKILGPKVAELMSTLTTPPRTLVTAMSSTSPSLLSAPASTSSVLRSRTNRTPHNEIPRMEGGSDGNVCGDGTVLQFNGEGLGGGGQSILLSVRFKVVDELSSGDNLRAGLAIVHERLGKVLTNFSILTVKKGKGPAVSGPDDPHWPVSGPETCQYIHPINKGFARRHNAQKGRGEGKSGTAESKQQTMTFGEFNDDAGYVGPNMLSTYVRVLTDENVTDALQCLEYEDGADSMIIMLKPHQGTDSSTKMKLFNVHRDTDVGGLALALDTLLKYSQRILLKAGKLDVNHVDELPNFTISFRQQRKGKSRTKEEEMLSLNKVPGYKNSGCPVVEIEMGDEDFENLRPVINYAIQAKLFNLYVGRNTFVVLMGGGVLTATERNYQQRLKRVHVLYTAGLTMQDFPHGVTLYKEVRGYVEGSEKGAKAQHHNVTLLKEMMDITIKVETDGDVIHKPVFQSVQMVTKGAAEGSIRVFYMREDPDVRRVVKNMAYAIVAWFAGYLKYGRKYTMDTVRPLMESFEVSAVQLAEGSHFDVNTLEVDTEFPDREEYLEEMEEELGLDEDNNNEDGKASLVVDTKGMLGDLLRRDMRMDNLERDGISKADGDDASSTGVSTNASGGVGDIARNHKDRKRENSQLKQQAILNNDEMERMRLQCEELRRKLEDSRISKNDGMQAEVEKTQQSEAEQLRADTDKDKANSMEVEAHGPTEAAAGDAGALVSETTGTKPVVDENSRDAEVGEAHSAGEAVKKIIPDENAEVSPKKGVTFGEKNHGKTQTGSSLEQPTSGTGEE